MQGFEQNSFRLPGIGAPHEQNRVRLTMTNAPAMHSREQYRFWLRRIAFRISICCTGCRLPHRHSSRSHERHQRFAPPEASGGHIAAARIDAMIGCAGESSSGRRDDLNDSAAWDASSGFHVAPDSSAGVVIEGENAGDATGVGLGCGDPSMVRDHIRISGHAVDGTTCQCTADTRRIDTTLVAL